MCISGWLSPEFLRPGRNPRKQPTSRLFGNRCGSSRVRIIRQRDLRSYPLHLLEQFDLWVALLGDFLHPHLVFLDALEGHRCRMKHSLQCENSARFGALTTSLPRCQTDPFVRPLQPQPGRYSLPLANSLGAPCRGLRPTALSRHTSNSPLHSIEFA
jgi:hypothetical protein